MNRKILKKLLSLLTVFAMVFSMIAVVQPMQADAATVEIPISNGGFENGAFGGAISGSNGATIVEKATHTGNYALKFDAKYSSANNEMLTMTVQLTEAVAAETSFTLSFWAKVASGSTGNAVHFDTHCTTLSWGNRVSSSGEKYPVPGGDWLEITKTITAPVGSQIIQVQFYLNSENTVATLDDISLKDANGTELLSTGGFENGALTGIFNANDALEIVCTPVHSGKYAAHADLTSGKGMTTTTIYLEPSTEARTMSLSYWLYIAPTATANGAHNSVLCFDTSSGSWTNLSTKSGAQYASYGVWTQKTLEVAVAANTNTLQIQLYAQDNGADFYIDDLSLTEEVAQVNHDVTLSFTQVTADNGTWQFSISEAPANKYYKVPATIDGVACNILMGESGGIMCVYPNFFTALGGAVPTQQIIIEEGAVLKAVDSNAGWAEIEGADTYTVTEKIDLSYADGAWSKTVYTTDVTLSLNQVTGDGTWQFSISEAPATKYYKVPAIIDGTECSFLMGESQGMMCVYPNFFTALGGPVPTESLVIPAGTVLKPVISDNGWKEIDTVNALKLTEGLNIQNNLGTWQDMSQYADVTFTEIKASDLSVYKWEDQAESQNRSVLGIKSDSVSIDNDASWGNFIKVAGKVLVDGKEVGVTFGMAPGLEGSSWGVENGILVYITGEGYWDAVTSASSVTICSGTMLISAVDPTHGYRFAEDFVMYKNDDGSWDTTEDPTVETTDITLSMQTVTDDGTWQFVPSQTLANKYYKVPVTIDGKACNVLMGESQGMMCIYPNFFTQLGGKVPAESFVISAGAMMKAVDENGWVEIEGAEILKLTQELKIENIAGKWVEMSKYSNVEFKEINAADLDVYYQNILRLKDYSEFEIQMALKQYPEYKPLYEAYGKEANMTTFGFYSTIPTLQIPNDANWATFQLLGTISVNGASPVETYVMQTPDSSDDAETAKDSGFLVRFYNGYVADAATSITIEPGTRIVTKDGTAGFVFVDGYTIYRDEDGNWSDIVPEGVNPVNTWGLTLGENIGVNFEMNVNTGDTISFTVNGTEVAAEQNGKIYTVYVAAAQMNDAIVISVNGNALEKTYSVRGYADIILAGTYGELTKDLVKNMLVYGGAAQTYFGYNTNNLASAGIEVTAAAPEGDGEIAVSGSVSGISFYGATLVHRTKTAVRFYFTGSVEDLTFKVNGDTVSETAKNERYYVEISGINPQDLGNEIEIVVSNGTDSLTVAYSPLDYMVRMYEKGSDTTQALVQALYGYYQAAVEYTA